MKKLINKVVSILLMLSAVSCSKYEYAEIDPYPEIKYSEKISGNILYVNNLGDDITLFASNYRDYSYGSNEGCMCVYESNQNILWKKLQDKKDVKNLTILSKDTDLDNNKAWALYTFTGDRNNKNFIELLKKQLKQTKTINYSGGNSQVESWNLNRRFNHDKIKKIFDYTLEVNSKDDILYYKVYKKEKEVLSFQHGSAKYYTLKSEEKELILNFFKIGNRKKYSHKTIDKELEHPFLTLFR